MVTGSSALQLTRRAATIKLEDCVKLLGVNIDKTLDLSSMLMKYVERLVDN